MRACRIHPCARFASLPVALAFLTFAPVASADGVVVKSDTFDHPVGSIIVVGEQVRLKAGQTITVLDRSGVVLLQSAGAYTGPIEKGNPGLLKSGVAVAAGRGTKTATGGVRTSGDDVVTTCGPDQQARPLNSADRCIPRAQPSRHLRISSDLTVESSFEGYAVCVGWRGSDDSEFLDGADPIHPLLLSASQSAVLKTAGAPTNSKADFSSIGCAGLSAETWKALHDSASQALTPNSAAVIMSAFARLRGDIAVEEQIKLASAKSETP